MILAPSARSQAPPPAPYPQDKILNDLISTHPYGIPGSMASTDDGHWLLVAEGGSVAFIEAGATTGDPFADPVKRVPIGMHAPLPVGMLLDPDAVLHPLDPQGNHPAPSDAYLYIAGGRMGLWVMSADPRPGQPGQASRIDNRSSNNPPIAQDSRLWCSNVDILTVGPRRYLVALFSGLAVNRLRIYDLDDARAVLGAAELGNEIAPLWNILLRRDPVNEFNPKMHTLDYGLHKAFGFAITADGSDVYAALGSHGLVRVSLTVDTGTGAITGFTRTGGPVLGTESPLYENDPNTPILRYGDYEFRHPVGGQYTDLRRRHGPLFTDVKVLRREGTEGFHKLFAAVDHLGWMRFDLTDTWGETLAPEHEEGIVFEVIPQYQGSTEPAIHQTSLIGATVSQSTFVRQLELVDTGSRVVMAAAAAQHPLIIEPMWRTEGWMLNYLAAKNYAGHFFGGEHDLTVVYEDPQDDGYTHQSVNFLGWGQYGGERVVLPRDLQTTGPGDAVPVFGGHATHFPDSILDPSPTPGFEDERQSTFYSEITGAGTRVEFKARYAEHRPGCYPHVVGYCILDPDILHTGSNDAGLPADGLRYTCSGVIHNHYDPPVGDPYDRTGSFGVLMNQGAQWAVSSTQTLLAGHDEDFSLTGADNMRWSLSLFDIGANLCGPGQPTWPELKKRVYFERDNDELGTTPRHYYGVGHVAGIHPDLLLFTQIKTHEGLIVLDRAMMVDAFDSVTSPGGPPINYNPLVGIGNPIIKRFHTHPQFSRIDTTNTNNHQAAKQIGVDGHLLTFFPRPFQMTKAGADPELRTLVAIPANSVRHESGTWPVAWNPPPQHDGFRDHAMLRILDVTDPATVRDQNDLYFEHTIYSPDKPASWADAAIFKFESNGRTFCFLGGLQGGLYVYELTDLMTKENDKVTYGQEPVFAQYEPMKSLTDEIECNIHGIVLDHVEWYDSQQILEREELYVYLSVRRVGILVLRFDPSKPEGSRLIFADRISTPGWVGLPVIRPGDNGQRHLIVPDGYAGLRIYGYNG